MLKLLISRAIKKYGLRRLLILIGDVAVKATKSKKDDVLWSKIKKLLK